MSTKSQNSATTPVAEEPIEAPTTPTAPTTEPAEPTKPSKKITKESFDNLSSLDLALIVFAFFFPFITMGFKKGWCSVYVWVCIVLEILVVSHLPAVLWAIWVVLTEPDTAIYDVEKAASPALAPSAAPASKASGPAIITSDSTAEPEVNVEVKEASTVAESK